MGEVKKLARPEKTEKGQKAVPAKESAKKPAPRVNIDGIKTYFRGVWSELKKVHWPTRKEVVTYTAVVVVAVIIVGFMIFIVDEALGFALSHLYE
ncbi:MAG: preprotein translocase subunit SecE [Heliobacteriaceae bacterium]|nr:preprotein translocase subunit SecE [Heliobacteriaceae bacterium]MDD4587864.1 preprotein translocase subunit SecE [Heliobacteriaceae bacterium]